jgi:hypothetical protein
MKIVCKTSQGSTTTWWRWRIIDGKKCWYPGKAVIDKSQLTWEPPEVVLEPKPSPPDLALPKSIAPPAPAPPLPVKNQDRLPVEDNPDPPEPIRQITPDLQQYEVQTVTAEPDKQSLFAWPEFTLLVAGTLMLVVGYAVWRRGTRSFPSVAAMLQRVASNGKDAAAGRSHSPTTREADGPTNRPSRGVFSCAPSAGPHAEPRG